MKIRLLLLSLAFFMHGTLYAKDSWVLVMNEHFVKKEIIHLTRPFTNIHNPYFIKEQGRYVLLVADDSAKLATFYHTYMVGMELQRFPYRPYETIGPSGEETNIGDYDDTFFHRPIDKRIFTIDGHWMNYINLKNLKYCQWEFFTTNSNINGKFIQYNVSKKLFRYVTYDNGVKDGIALNLEVNGDTICLAHYRKGIRVLQSCYDKKKKLEFFTSIKDHVDRIIDSADIREFQIDSIGHYNGLYKKVGIDGKVMEEGMYKDNQRDGEWKYYDSHGRVIKTEIYREDQLE